MSSYHRALLFLAASRQVVPSASQLVLFVCNSALLHLPVPVWANGRQEPSVLHGHWRFCHMASHSGALLSLAALCLVLGSLPFRIQGNCSRRLKHGCARPRWCAIRPQCQCEQADDRSRLYSTATGAPAPWCSTAGPSRGSQCGAQFCVSSPFVPVT